jgi:hypothetical protein
LKMVLIGCPETSVWNCHSTPRNIAEELRYYKYPFTHTPRAFYIVSYLTCVNNGGGIWKRNLQPYTCKVAASVVIPTAFPLFIVRRDFKKKIPRITCRQCDSAAVVGLDAKLLQIRICG